MTGDPGHRAGPKHTMLGTATRTLTRWPNARDGDVNADEVAQ